MLAYGFENEKIKIMTNFVINRKKYGSDLASWLEGVDKHSHSVYDVWSYDFYKTMKVRKKHFLLDFRGTKKNFKPEYLISLN